MQFFKNGFQVDTIDGVVGRQNGNPAADYSEGASHVLAVIHQILNHHRTLETKWQAKKIKLHQRLALRLFQEDVKQVSRNIKKKKKIREFCDVIQTSRHDDKFCREKFSNFALKL